MEYLNNKSQEKIQAYKKHTMQTWDLEDCKRWKEFLKWWKEYKEDNYCQDPRIYFKSANDIIADIDDKIQEIKKGEKK